MMKPLIPFILALLLSWQLPAQILLDSTYISVSTVAQNIYFPWEIVWGPDNALWYTQLGSVNRINPQTGESNNLVTVPDFSFSGSKQMGLAIDPAFDVNHHVYIDYNYTGEPYNPPLNHNVYLKIVRYTYNVALRVLENPITLLDGIKLFDGYHDGGKMIIYDNHILISIGDAKQVENPELHPYVQPGDPYLPQNLTVFNGKILRINLDGSVPEDNPYAVAPYDETPRNYIWSYGHRNTQGLVVGNGGKVYYAEHGRENDDEMGMIEKGMNYGWPLIEGFCDQPFETVSCDTIPNHREPLVSWNPNVAPSNMEYVDDNSPIGEFRNSIFVATLTGDGFGNHIAVLSLNQSGDEVIHQRNIMDEQYGRIRDLCIAPNGDIYFITSNTTAGGNNSGDDKIFRIAFHSKLTITGISSAEHEHIGLFPNPSQQDRMINVKCPDPDGSIQLHDASGVLLKAYKVTQRNMTLDTSDLQPGIYIINYAGRRITFTRKLLIK